MTRVLHAVTGRVSLQILAFLCGFLNRVIDPRNVQTSPPGITWIMPLYIRHVQVYCPVGPRWIEGQVFFLGWRLSVALPICRGLHPARRSS